MKFEMICTGGPFGDSCCNYDVKIEGNCTVREFIESVLKEKPGEWGTFEIVKDMQYTCQSGVDDCEYKKGEITRNFKRKETDCQVWCLRSKRKTKGLAKWFCGCVCYFCINLKQAEVI